MAINGAESTAGFQVSVKRFERGVLDLHFTTALTTDQVMMILLGDLVNQMPVAYVGGVRQSVFGQEFECAVDGGFCQAGKGLFSAGKYLGRGEMRALVMQDVQNCHALGRHAESA